MAELSSKAKYWAGVLYPENMVSDWQKKIDELVQVSYSYCVHDKDTTSKDEEDRKVHVHLVLAFPNSTTYKHAFSVYQRLSQEGKNALNKIEQVINIRWIYEYLIHNTTRAKDEGKYQYPTSERIDGNNFDIGAFEQLSVADKRKMCKELADDIVQCSFTNFADFYFFVSTEKSEEYFEILLGYSNFFKSLIGGVYHKLEKLHCFEATTTSKQCDEGRETIN